MKRAARWWERYRETGSTLRPTFRSPRASQQLGKPTHLMLLRIGEQPNLSLDGVLALCHCRPLAATLSALHAQHAHKCMHRLASSPWPCTCCAGSQGKTPRKLAPLCPFSHVPSPIHRATGTLNHEGSQSLYPAAQNTGRRCCFLQQALLTHRHQVRHHLVTPHLGDHGAKGQCCTAGQHVPA